MRPPTGGANDLPSGRRIINMPPTESKLIQGRSARPGDPSFDQNFGASRFNQHSRDGVEQRDRGVRTPHFDHNL